eukprot:TRINITY_DN6180_c0_g1_i1.p1 TRINITY_DN6180_c0_g1~~TRINITY_DN6180_c0_g1_i1.p1  ORF type:complete len:302 (-),score=82.49 TRINITY_DN6180_c0_g1_i1:520-1350(-)
MYSSPSTPDIDDLEDLEPLPNNLSVLHANGIRDSPLFQSLCDGSDSSFDPDDYNGPVLPLSTCLVVELFRAVRTLKRQHPHISEEKALLRWLTVLADLDGFMDAHSLAVKARRYDARFSKMNITSAKSQKFLREHFNLPVSKSGSRPCSPVINKRHSSSGAKRSKHHHHHSKKLRKRLKREDATPADETSETSDESLPIAPSKIHKKSRNSILGQRANPRRTQAPKPQRIINTSLTFKKMAAAHHQSATSCAAELFSGFNDDESHCINLLISLSGR